MKITYWNVKGLRSPFKRLKILCPVKRLKTDITLFQETHLTSPDLHHMKKLCIGTVLGLNALDRKAGVIILIQKNLPCKVLSIDTDSQGRFIYIHIELGNRELVVSMPQIILVNNSLVRHPPGYYALHISHI